jgi:hypothetical protein
MRDSARLTARRLFDGGLGSAYLARIIGQKKAREIWFLCRQYDAKQALDMGLVNTVVPLLKLEEETLKWCREMLELSPTALRFLKAAMNADCDGQIGLLDFGGDATLLYYSREAGRRNAYVEKREAGLQEASAISVKAWLAARPKTLSASIVPVLVGTALANAIHWPAFVSRCQARSSSRIGTNPVNDALDFKRGADTADPDPIAARNAGRPSSASSAHRRDRLLRIATLCAAFR